MEFEVHLIDPFAYQAFDKLLLEERERFIRINPTEFLRIIDYFLVNFVQAKAGNAIMDITSKGKTSYVIDLVGASDGLYYIGIVQNKQLEPWETSEEKNELMDSGEYQRVNFLSFSYDSAEYLGGAGSSEKVTWAKVHLRRNSMSYMFVDFVRNPKRFTIHGQGPSILDFGLRKITQSEIDNLRFGFREIFDSYEYVTMFFMGKLVRYGYKVMGNGFGIFVLRNYTEDDILMKINILNKKNVKLGECSKFFQFPKFFEIFKKINFFSFAN